MPLQPWIHILSLVLFQNPAVRLKNKEHPASVVLKDYVAVVWWSSWGCSPGLALRSWLGHWTKYKNSCLGFNTPPLAPTRLRVCVLTLFFCVCLLRYKRLQGAQDRCQDQRTSRWSLWSFQGPLVSVRGKGCARRCLLLLQSGPFSLLSALLQSSPTCRAALCFPKHAPEKHAEENAIKKNKTERQQRQNC